VSPSYSLLPQPDESPLESLSPPQLSELESLESPVHESGPESSELESPLHESSLASLELESPLHDSLASLELESPLHDSLASLELESPLHDSFGPESTPETVQLPSLAGAGVSTGVGRSGSSGGLDTLGELPPGGWVRGSEGWLTGGNGICAGQPLRSTSVAISSALRGALGATRNTARSARALPKKRLSRGSAKPSSLRLCARSSPPLHVKSAEFCEPRACAARTCVSQLPAGAPLSAPK